MFKKTLSAITARTAWRLLRLDITPTTRWLYSTLDWPETRRSQWRLQKLGDIIEFAWEHVPFYRTFWGDHRVTIRRPRDLTELEAFPILTKAVFKEHHNQLVPSNLPSIRHIPKCTGGSTSEPVAYFLDVEQWCLIQAFHAWGWGLMGYELGDPVAVIAGGSLIPSKVSLKSRIRSVVTRRMFLYGVAMNAEIAERYCRQMETFGAEYIYGYPSTLFLMAKHMAGSGRRLSSLKGILSTAEMLQPHYRATIEKVFGCPVVNNYGSNDGGVQSYQPSDKEGFYYNDLQSVLETTAGLGKPGDLLITNLWNRSTPFIRYQNGDIVTLDKTAQATRGFPAIKSVHGRTADILHFRSGISLTGPALTLIFGPMKIDGWQIVQTGPDSLEVRIQSSRPLDAADAQEIRAVLNHHLLGKVEVKIREVEELSYTVGGKLKPVCCEWTDPAGAKSGQEAISL